MSFLIKKAPIHIFLVQPARYIHTMAFLEVVTYFKSIFEKLGHDVTVARNLIDKNRLNIVVAGHLLSEIDRVPAGSVILNCEQLSEDKAWYQSEKYRVLLESHTYWDYSATNMPFVNNENKSLVPFYFCPELKKIINKKLDIDLLFYGSTNEHRTNILESIRRSGINLQVLYGVYGSDRDEFISRSRAVLNLHFYESQILEQVRCFYPLINEKPVISENYPVESAPDLYRSALFLPGEQDLVSYIVELFREREQFAMAANGKAEAFRKSDPIPEVSEALRRAVARWESLAP